MLLGVVWLDHCWFVGCLFGSLYSLFVKISVYYTCHNSETMFLLDLTSVCYYLSTSFDNMMH